MTKIWKFAREGTLSYLKAAYLVTDWFIRLFDRGMFCKLFNLRSAILGWPIRFEYSEDRRMYLARSHGMAQYFLNRSQALYAYRIGLTSRAESLGKVYLLDKIDLEEGDLIVDCGANVGDLLLYFKHKGLNVRYVGFEPSPSEYGCLELNGGAYKTFNAGLWNEDSNLQFYVSSNNADSSFIEPPSYDEIRIVPAVRLDKILSEKIKLFKVEAEGGEPEAIAGSEKILDNVQYISADVDYERGTAQESTLAPVVNYLASRGFELIDVTNSRAVGRLVALFRNANFVHG